MGPKVTGLNEMLRTLEEAQRAAAELDGELGHVQFNVDDLSSVEAAIAESHRMVDERLGDWYGNPLVDQMAAGAKAHFETELLSKVQERTLNKGKTDTRGSDDLGYILERIRDAIGDLRRADYQAFDRHVERLARLLGGPVLTPLVDGLTKGVDLDAWLEAGAATEGGMVGSARLDWPRSDEAQMGIVILLARRFAADSRAALNFAHRFFYSGSKFTQNLQHMVSQVFVPFERDFSAYVLRHTGEAASSRALTDRAKYPRRVFVVHGHDGEAREAVARFMEKLDFEVIVLHEQANRGRTIIEKFEEHADVGFAIVLLTPDDLGSSKDGEPQFRARQNVILELGYFFGKLGRERVMALKRGDLEIPSDFLGVVYTVFDEQGGWKEALVRELRAAEYAVDLPG